MVDKVVLEKSLFEMAVERGRETRSEVAFFMVGLVRKKVAYVYDLVEFDYEERSPISVRSGVERKLKLAGILPLGLELLGNMHKHPGSPTPSWIDREMFLSYARGGGARAFVIYTVDPVEARAYTVQGGQVIEVGCEIRELEEEEKLVTFNIKFPLTVRACVQKGASLLELRALLGSRICHELEKQASFPKLFLGSEELTDDGLPEGPAELLAKPLRPVDIEAGWMEGLFYRLYIEEEAEDEEILGLVREALGPHIKAEMGEEAPGGAKHVKVLRASRDTA